MTILIRLLAGAILATSLVGVAFAQNDNAKENPFVFQHGNQYGMVSIPGMMAALPETSDGIIEHRNVLHRPGGGVRVFRLYNAVPQHYHMKSDAIVYITKGRGRFKIGEAEPVEASEGDMLFWAAGTLHGVPKIIDGPIEVIAFDLPQRDPDDTIWANPHNAPSFLE